MHEAGGLYRVDVDRGADLLTHGPDPERVGATAAFTRGSPERAPICTNGQGYNRHVLYARISGQPSNLGTQKPNLQAAIRWDDVTVPVTVTEPVKTLTSGTPLADTIGARDAMKRYRIQVPGGSNRLKVVVDGRACQYLSGPCEPDLDLYLLRASSPTRTEFDCRSKSVGADETCVVTDPARGAWRIGVDNAYARPGSDYVITAKVKN